MHLSHYLSHLQQWFNGDCFKGRSRGRYMPFFDFYELFPGLTARYPPRHDHHFKSPSPRSFICRKAVCWVSFVDYPFSFTSWLALFLIHLLHLAQHLRLHFLDLSLRDVLNCFGLDMIKQSIKQGFECYRRQDSTHCLGRSVKCLKSASKAGRIEPCQLEPKPKEEPRVSFRLLV